MGNKNGLTGLKLKQYSFWSELKKTHEKRDSDLKFPEPKPLHYMPIGLVGHEFRITPTINSRENFLRVGLVIDIKQDEEQNNKYFNLLKDQKLTIEKELNEKLQWQELIGKNMCRINLYYYADPMDESKWPEYFSWMLNKIDMFDKVFRSRILKII
ncbi:MAG: DUF4268 domain-containing protein [Proteobacteria bacterium]|nr:DUF4268 domain-containing protein [Pseudomonadota bacterium]